MMIQTVQMMMKNSQTKLLEALKILSHPAYHLGDGYPTLCKVYAIAVVIPISSSTAERSFSALKRVKTRIRSTMFQGRLEALLLMVVERQILQSKSALLTCLQRHLRN